MISSRFSGKMNGNFDIKIDIVRDGDCSAIYLVHTPIMSSVDEQVMATSARVRRTDGTEDRLVG